MSIWKQSQQASQRWILPLVLLAFLMSQLAAPLRAAAGIRVSLPESATTESVTGRVILFVSKDHDTEPRLQRGRSVIRFAGDVEGLKPGQSIELNADTPGFPVERLADLPEGRYSVQVVCNVYALFHRADGHSVWLPDIEWGTGNSLSRAGNFFSKPVQMNWHSSNGDAPELTLDQRIAKSPELVDTQWTKRIKIRSRVLSEFWGCPVFIGAVVSLPRGYDEHPDRFYPVNYQHGWGGLTSGGLEEGNPLFEEWMSDNFPRMISVKAYMPSHYFGNGHAMNSANMGPWGDAYMKELIPEIESRFRIILEPWARTLSGGSTGGWIVLALQLHHPKVFGGMWCWNPDSVDFRRMGLLNVYEDDNAFTTKNGMERSQVRDISGQQLETVRESVRLEEVNGSRGRSHGQLDAYHALFGPVGADGYPRRLWNPETGVIDKTVAEYWGEHFDLRNYLDRNWAKIGPDLVGKLFFFCGEMDNFFLNEALYGIEEFLEGANAPRYEGRFVWGRPRKGHGWTPWNRRNGELFRIMAKHIAAKAPPGVDILKD